MEKIYRIEDTGSMYTLVFPSIGDILNVREGEVYNTTHLIEKAEFKNEYQAQIYEYHSKTDTLIITDAEGGKPFAVASNDCIRDNFPPFCLSRVVLDKGYHIMRAVTRPNPNGGRDITTVIIMQVVDVLPQIRWSIESASINVKILCKDTLANVNSSTYARGILRDAFTHLKMVGMRSFDSFLTPKYCFNPGRITTNKLFTQQSDGNLVSYLENGAQLVLNKKSYARFADPTNPNSPILDHVFLRCFFPRIHKKDSIIYVDGAALTMVTEKDIAEYIEISKMPAETVSRSIKQIHLMNGSSYFATTSWRSPTLRPIYRTINGFGTFPLNDYELRMNGKILDIAIN